MTKRFKIIQSTQSIQSTQFTKSIQSIQSTQSTQFASDAKETIDNTNKQNIDNYTNFDLIYHNFDSTKMWMLKSGRIVEEVIYKYARNLKYESHLHSFIINDIDVITKSLFSEEEWEEIINLK